MLITRGAGKKVPISAGRGWGWARLLFKHVSAGSNEQTMRRALAEGTLSHVHLIRNQQAAQATVRLGEKKCQFVLTEKHVFLIL